MKIFTNPMIDFRQELAKYGYNKGNSIDVETLINEILPNLEKMQQNQCETSKVTRVEVIQHSPPYNGRAYTNYNAKEVDIQIQDLGKTLKIFVK